MQGRKEASVYVRIFEETLCEKDARLKILEQQRTLQSREHFFFCLLLGYYTLLFIIMGCTFSPQKGTFFSYVPFYCTFLMQLFERFSQLFLFLLKPSEQVESCCRGICLDREQFQPPVALQLQVLKQDCVQCTCRSFVYFANAHKKITTIIKGEKLTRETVPSIYSLIILLTQVIQQFTHAK